MRSPAKKYVRASLAQTCNTMGGWAAEFWQDEELADVDVVLAVAGGDSSNSSSSSSTTQLCKLAAHRVILSRSPYLKAQVLRWQHRQPIPSAGTDADNLLSACIQLLAAQTPLPDQARPQVVLTLQNAAQEPAARAVLASLYDKPLPELLFGLCQEQQLSAVVLADMWQVPNFSTAAAEALVVAAEGAFGLQAAVRQQLLGMQAHPVCLLPVLEAVLLATFGDLEAVWRDAELQAQLLALPLPAMEVLLASSKLKVASEDTVLYTAQQYVEESGDEQQQKAARQQLAPLIRCPHVSQYWLSASVLSDEAPKLLLHELRQPVKQLVMLRLANVRSVVDAAAVKAHLPGAPASWALEPRPSVVVQSVEVSWVLPVNEVRAAAERCASTQEAVVLWSPQATPPLRGLTWQLKLQCNPVGAASATIGIHAAPCHPVGDLFSNFRFSISVLEVRRTAESVQGGRAGRGWTDFFDVGAMKGGWSDTALAAKGVPSSEGVKVLLVTLAASELHWAPSHVGAAVCGVLV